MPENPASGGCSGKSRFARAVQFVAPIGDRGIVFADQLQDESQRGTLQVAAMKGWPAAPVQIRAGIDAASVILAGWSPLYLPFTVSKSGPDEDGTVRVRPGPLLITLAFAVRPPAPRLRRARGCC